MKNAPKELDAVLREYTRIQQQEQELKQRKQALQDKLKAYARERGLNRWYPEVDGARLKVSYRTVSQVDYDEELLRNRLKDRYPTVLEPDIRKIRTELPQLENELAPLLDRIGSPSPEKVKDAVKSGTISADEFKGAFHKTLKEYISVAAVPQGERQARNA